MQAYHRYLTVSAELRVSITTSKMLILSELEFLLFVAGQDILSVAWCLIPARLPILISSPDR